MPYLRDSGWLFVLIILRVYSHISRPIGHDNISRIIDIQVVAIRILEIMLFYSVAIDNSFWTLRNLLIDGRS